jgi:hypothetical protein
MKVKELIEKLQEFPSDLEVLLSSDPEGNCYRRVFTIDGPYGLVNYDSNKTIIDDVVDIDEPVVKDNLGIIIWP